MSWEIVDPRKLKDSTGDTVLLSMVRGGSPMHIDKGDYDIGYAIVIG